MLRLEGLSEIAGDFDAMLIDQFGVLHDGQKLYPGAANAMGGLQALGIPVVIMTNSARRSIFNVARLVRMGIDRGSFLDCISSGEVAFHSLAVQTAYVIGKSGIDYSIEGIRYVDDPAKAEVMLILGSNAPTTSLDDYRTLMAGIRIPAVCCNPDKWMITSTGLQPASGAIASLYEEMGGTVRWIGKPYPEIYKAALSLLGNPKRVLCIGDSAEHDVAGGRGAGLSTLLVQQGVCADMDETSLHPKPDYICSSFIW